MFIISPMNTPPAERVISAAPLEKRKIHLSDKKAIQDSKCEGWHREEVHGRDDLAVVAQKGGLEFPGLV